MEWYKLVCIRFRFNFDCYAIAIDNSGNVYAGGAFLQAGGTTVNYIAKWDGTSWTALGSGLNDICRSIAVDDMGNVYAGGQFTQAGGVLVNYIAKWDGTSWSALGSGFNFWCYSIDINSNGDIYAGGGFTTAGGNGASRIAMWDGSQWSALSSGLNGQCQTIKCHLDGSIFVGGTFTAAGGNTANRIAKWDGLQWSPLGTGLSSTCFGVDLDGSGNLFAAGIFTTAGGISANRIAQWDGTILPVEWLSFKGVHSDQNVQLFWQTTSEHSNLGYQVQHSSDGEKWRNIGFVEGKGYTSGIENYYFIHKGPHLKDNYYRLKQIDFNGNSNYSKIINITVNLNSEIKIFPNPTNNNIKIYDVNYNSFIIVLYDIYGRKILEKEFNNNENELDLSLTAHGLYYVKIVVNDDIIHNSTIIKN